jgi:hypothetical protein
MTVQICYSSPWKLLYPLVTSEVLTDLFVSYDLFLVSGQKKTAFSFIKFEWPEEDKVTTGNKSAVS